MDRHYRIDDSVILTFLILGAIGFLASAFRIINYEPCTDFTISTTSRTYWAGEVIKLSSSERSVSNDYRWDLGDQSQQEINKGIVYHTYKNPGNYVVTLKLNKHCFQSINITVMQPGKIQDPNLVPVIQFPTMATVGEPVNFSDATPSAHSWTWRFGETANVDATSKNPSYTYQSTGLKTVILTINGNDKFTATGKIFVAPPKTSLPALSAGKKLPPRTTIVINDHPYTKPISDTPKAEVHQPRVEIRRAPDINQQTFREALIKVADHKIAIQYFSPFMCDAQNLHATLNGESVSFDKLFNQIESVKGSSKIKELKVQLVKNETTNCVVGVNVWMSLKRKFLGVF